MNFRQLSGRLEYLSSTSINFPCVQKTFRQLFVSLSTSVNFLFSREAIRKLASAFRGAETSSASLHQFSVPPGEPSVNLRQYSMRPGDLPSTSANFPYGQETFRQLSAFPVDLRELSVRLRELLLTSVNILCGQETLRQKPSTFHAGGKPSTNIRQLPCRRKTFCQLPSTFCAAVRISLNFLYDRENFRQLLSTFCAAERSSVNFRQL